MKTFLDFIRRYNYFFLFLLLEIVGFSFLFRYNNYQGSVWYTAANGFAAKVNSIYAEGEAFFHLRDVNARLTRENTVLQSQNAQLRNAVKQLTHDSTYTEKVVKASLAGFHLLNAKVVSNSIHSSNNYLIIDKGELDGVHPEMGVVGGGGIIGIVYLAGEHYSLVIPIINKQSSISCRVRGKNYFGYLEWEGRKPLNAVLNDIPRYAKIKVGDIVETSGYSSIFPPGIFVGKISSVKPSNDGQSYSFGVHLGTDFSTLTDACVIMTHYKAEIDTLTHHAAEFDLHKAQVGAY